MIETIFEVLRSTLNIECELVKSIDYTEHNKLGLAFGARNIGESVTIEQILKPENKHLLIEARKILHGKKRKYPTYHAVYINTDLIKKKLPTMEQYIRIETGGWYEYPLSFRSAAAVVICHELTHIQLDQEGKPECAFCLKCDHCDDFRERMIKNWNIVLDSKCLRKMDFKRWGIPPGFASFEE